MSRPVTFFVPGIPATAGSKRGFPIHRRDGSVGVGMAPDNPRSRSWMGAVASAALCGEFFSGAVRLEVELVFVRPKGHYRRDGMLTSSAPRLHVQRPDCTKAVRCIEDALKSVLWKDDAQVARLAVSKRWANAREVGGAHVTVTDLEAVLESVPANLELEVA